MAIPSDSAIEHSPENSKLCVAIDLFKNPRYKLCNPNNGKNESDSKVAFNKYPFTCFGYFDGVEFGHPTTLDELYTSEHEGNSKYLNCEQQTLHLYSKDRGVIDRYNELVFPKENVENELNVVPELVFPKENVENELNEVPELVFPEKNVENELIMVSELEFNRNYSDFDKSCEVVKKHLGDSDNYCLFNSLDYADLVLITRGQKFDQLCRQIFGLRKLTFDDEDGTPVCQLFKSTYSLILFPTKKTKERLYRRYFKKRFFRRDFKKRFFRGYFKKGSLEDALGDVATNKSKNIPTDNGELYDISIRIASDSSKSDTTNLIELKTDLQGLKDKNTLDSFRIKNVFGKYDYDVHITEIKQNDIVDLRKEIPSNYDYMISSNIRWLFSDPSCDSNPEKQYPKGQNTVASQGKDINRDIEQRISKFKKFISVNPSKLKNKNKRISDESSKLKGKNEPNSDETLELKRKKELTPLIRKFMWAYQDHSIDIDILKNISLMIEALTDRDWTESATKATILISEYMDQQSHASRSIFEKPSENTLFRGSVSKLERFYSNIMKIIENSFFAQNDSLSKDVRTNVTQPSRKNEGGDKWFHLLLINHKAVSHSYEYTFFPESEKVPQITYHLIVITMGMEQIGKLEDSIPVLLHEIAHYIPYNDALLKKSNELLYTIVSNYFIKALIRETFIDLEPKSDLPANITDKIKKLEDEIVNKTREHLILNMKSFEGSLEKFLDKRFDKKMTDFLIDLSSTVLTGQLSINRQSLLSKELDSQNHNQSVWVEVFKLKKEAIVVYESSLDINENRNNDLTKDFVDLLTEYLSDCYYSKGMFFEKLKKIISNIKKEKKEEKKELINIVERYTTAIDEQRETSDKFWRKIIAEINITIQDILSEINNITSPSSDMNSISEPITARLILNMMRFSSTYPQRGSNFKIPLIPLLTEKYEVFLREVERWIQIHEETVSDYFMSYFLFPKSKEYLKFMDNKYKDKSKTDESFKLRRDITASALDPELLNEIKEEHSYFIEDVYEFLVENGFIEYLENNKHDELNSLRKWFSEYYVNNSNAGWDLKLIERVINIERYDYNE